MSAHRETARKRRGKGFSRTEKIVGLVILLFAIWSVYSLSQPSIPTTTTTIPPTTTQGGAPDFTLPVVGPNGLTGEKISLSSFRGKVVFLEFMVPWCSVCQEMAPTIVKLYGDYGPKDVVFISVSAAWSGATADDAAKFIRDYGTNWIHVYDSSGVVFSMYGVNATPTFFILGKSGYVATRYEGTSATYDILAADLTRLNA